MTRTIPICENATEIKFQPHWHETGVFRQWIVTIEHSTISASAATSTTLLYMSARFIWVQGAAPPNKGSIVAIRDHHLSGWSYLAKGLTRQDIEKDFAEAYDFRGWPETVICQVALLKDGKITDEWQFKIEPPTITDL